MNVYGRQTVLRPAGLWILAFFLCAVPAARGQGLPSISPKRVGVSAERLKRIDPVLQGYVNGGRVAGAVALVARHGKIVHSRAYGWADKGRGRPMRTDTVFRMASMTKPITTVAVMMLYEEGKLGLNDPISRYLPEFEGQQVLVPADGVAGKPPAFVPAKTPITVRHLLTHTSGISYRFLAREPISRLYREAGISDGLRPTEGTIGEMTKKLARLPLAHHPGEAFTYGLNTDVLGRLVEVLSGQSLDRFFSERIFKPLRMRDTAFYLSADQQSRMAEAYTLKAGEELEALGGRRVTEGYLEYDPSATYNGPRTYFSGGAGLVSTSGDYLRFCQMLLNGGELEGIRLLGPKTVELMTRNQIKDLNYWTAGRRFGLGFEIHADPTASGEIGSAGEYSWGGFWGTSFWIDPAEGVIGLLLTQQVPNSIPEAYDKFRALTYAAIVEAATVRMRSPR